MPKDWTGNSKAVWATLGASNHTENEREKNDYYATDGKAAEILLDVESFTPTIWENAVGGGDLADVFIKNGYKVRASDIIDRGYPNTIVHDYLSWVTNDLFDCVISNPPYSKAEEFIRKSLSLLNSGGICAMFLKIQFLESAKRKALFEEFPPKYVYVFSKRANCARNGDFKGFPRNSAICYCWYIWEKGFKGEPVIRWI